MAKTMAMTIATTMIKVIDDLQDLHTTQRQGAEITGNLYIFWAELRVGGGSLTRHVTRL